MGKDYLTSVKQYGKIEWDDEDDLIKQLINAVQRLAMHYYENREEIGGSSVMPMGMNWMIEHLRLGDGV